MSHSPEIASLIAESERLLALCPDGHEMRNAANVIGLLSHLEPIDVETMTSCVERMREMAGKHSGS